MMSYTRAKYSFQFQIDIALASNYYGRQLSGWAMAASELLVLCIFF